jgi:glycerol-3-phosphate dehydrogenase
MGTDFGHGLYQAEVDYLLLHEWAVNTDDILWRRTKLGIEFSELEVEKLKLYLHKQVIGLEIAV